MSIVVNSFPYLCGRTVQVALGGLDCGDIAVAANGSLTIPFGSDDQGLLTAAYLMSISSPGSYGDAEVALTFTDAEGNVMTAYVPLVVGYGYTAQGSGSGRTATNSSLPLAKGSASSARARAGPCSSPWPGRSTSAPCSTSSFLYG
jgi:hypothetical protein